MNVYLIQEDGQSYCVQAGSMQEAVKNAEEMYIISLMEDDAIEQSVAHERQYYRNDVIQSCQLIAELKNP